MQGPTDQYSIGYYQNDKILGGYFSQTMMDITFGAFSIR